MDSPVLYRDIGNGKKHRMFLSSDELRQIKRETGRGFYSLYSNFATDADPFEVETVIRLALIGGGMDPTNALELVEYYCRPPRPLKDVYILAYEILAAVWNGAEPTKSKNDDDMSDEDIDRFFSQLEAIIVAGGGDPGVLKGKSIAEVQEFVRLHKLAKEGKDGITGKTPDADTFNAIKAASAGMT